MQTQDQLITLTVEQTELLEDLQEYEGMDYVTARYVIDNY
jgi:hypothetical protein